LKVHDKVMDAASAAVAMNRLMASAALRTQADNFLREKLFLAFMDAP